MIVWTADKLDRVRDLWGQGLRRHRIAAAVTAEWGVEVTPNAIFGIYTRENLHSPAEPGRVRPLPGHHPALHEAATIYPRSVRSPDGGNRVLLTGRNQSKLGQFVQKGAWAGMPIFSLSLEERATCPHSCGHWRTCYGNTMPFAVRYRHGPELERALDLELVALQRRHPHGFVVRLHLLGDFYSVAYVERWADWLDRFPALRVFGYTARGPDEIGRAVHELSAAQWDRFAIRWSSAAASPQHAVTLWQVPSDQERRRLAKAGTIVCPAQTGATRSCGTCALCWAAPAKAIAFIAHGSRGGRPPHN